MKKVHNVLHQRAKGVFSKIKGDQKLFQKIVADMKKNAGDLSPRLNWHLVEKSHEERSNLNSKASDDIYARYDDNAYQRKFSSSEKILDEWIGCNGMKTVDRETIENYSDFLAAVDFLGLLPTLIEQQDKFDYKITDLGSIIDINLISGLVDPGLTRLYVLEVGGGYGRLAEAFLNIYKGQVKYVLLDAVPASLMFAYLYLKKNYPDLKLGFYYNDDEFDMQRFDLYIMPAWHFERLNRTDYDVCVNIESMQEMLQAHVDYYIDLFDRQTKVEGLIYISNAHDYVFKGDWHYPDNWERLMVFNTPRSWTSDHPTEIFRKKAHTAHKLKNLFIAAGYRHHLNQAFGRRTLSEAKDGQCAVRRSARLNNADQNKAQKTALCPIFRKKETKVVRA